MCMNIYPYEYTHAHLTHMSTSKEFDRLDIKIHEFDQTTSKFRWVN
jgi:hypothetical protein